MIKYILPLLLTSIIINFTHAQTFEMRYSQISANEARFDVEYKGPAGEISLPKRGRILRFQDQEDLNFGDGKLRIGIRIGKTEETASNENTETKSSGSEYTINFSYSLILPHQGGFGNISEHWYPILNDQDSTYNISTIKTPNQELFIFPYESRTEEAFTFNKNQIPNLVISKHVVEKSENTSIPITLFKSSSFKTSLLGIDQLYTHFQGIFGNLDINEIIIINNPLIREQSFISNSQLYLTIPSHSNINQLNNIFINAWSEKKPEISSRLFNMFKDAVLRINKLEFNNSELVSSIETDPSYIVPVAPKSYYENLLKTKFDNNEIVEADVSSMLNNFGILHMAWYNIGAETLLNGIKSYFANNTANTSSNSNISNTNDASDVSDTKNTALQSDVEKINWNTITQNQLKEPLFSLYTKDILREHRPIIPHLVADGSKVSRNSDYIPNLTLIQSDGSTKEIDWNNLKTIDIDIKENSYSLDPERQVPQRIYRDSQYTFNIEEQKQIRLTLFAAEKQKAPGEQSLRAHLEIMKFTASGDNAFNIEEGTTTYITVSHIFSNIKGTLKDAIKESIFIIKDNRPIHIATRMKI